MNVSITQVPIWLSTLFGIIFSTIPVFLIANTVQKVLASISYKNTTVIRKNIITFYWTYFLLIGIVSLTGFFVKNSLPPRIILCLVIPLFIFYVFYVQKINWFKKVLENIKLEELIFIHVFRFVGVFFFLVYAYNGLPKTFAFVGGSGDILVAILVFPVMLALKHEWKHAKLLVWLWNCIGLIDIIAVLFTAIITTQKAMVHNKTGVAQFGSFPFSWIPAFAPATIIFLHILVFKKLKKTDTNL